MEISVWFVCVCVCENWEKFCSTTWRNRNYLEELDLAENMILKWIFKKYGSYVNRVMNAGNFLNSGSSKDSLLHNRSKSFDFGRVQ